MEAEAPTDGTLDDPNALARAVALLERVGGASVEEAREMRRARAEGSVDEIVESARDRAAHILSSVVTSIDRATESEVATTEHAFIDLSKELIRVRESLGSSRDAVVDALVLPAAVPKVVAAPIDLRPSAPSPAEIAARAHRDQPVSAADTYFALLHTVPAQEIAEAAGPEVAAPEVAAPEVAAPEVVAPEVVAPEVAAVETAVAAVDVDTAVTPDEATATATEPTVVAPGKPRYEIPWFLNPPPPRPSAPTVPPETAPTPTTPSGDLLPSAKVAAPQVAPAPPTVAPPPVEAAPEPAPAPSTRPAELMPDAKAGSKLRLRRLLARVFRDVGVLLIAFSVLQLWGTGLLQSRSQHELRADFAQAVASAHAQRARAAALVVAGKDTTVRQVIPPTPSTGDPVARIKIPAIGVDQIVVEGTGVSELRRGPGHDESTPLPGGTGDSVITGHRTTYGAPFNHLDELEVGDKISVTTTEGSATYEVSDGPKSVSADAVAPAGGADRLILTTSQPKYKASEQLAVVARLRNPPTGTAATVADRAATAPTVGSYGWFESSVWASVLLWGALLLIVYMGMHRLATRWRSSKVVIFTLAAIPLAVTAFLFLQAVGRVFPANY